MAAEYLILSIFWSLVGLLTGVSLGYFLCHVAPQARRDRHS